jgi:hypothetical protein
MSKRLEIEKYGLDSYDDFLSLRPSRLLIASLIFLCRDLVVIGLFGVSKLSGASGEVPPLLNDIVDPETVWSGCLAAVPAALVLYALIARSPTSAAFVRWIWRHGRSLMSLSALSAVVIAVAQYGSVPRFWVNSPLVVKAIAAAELTVVGYVLLSARVRHTFLDFPSA